LSGVSVTVIVAHRIELICFGCAFKGVRVCVSSFQSDDEALATPYLHPTLWEASILLFLFSFHPYWKLLDSHRADTMDQKAKQESTRTKQVSDSAHESAPQKPKVFISN
jgi:hypothetical protein